MHASIVELITLFAREFDGFLAGTSSGETERERQRGGGRLEGRGGGRRRKG